MSALSEISALISGLNIPVETGVFSGPAPSTYTVLVPISDGFDLHADNEPGVDIQEVRISIFTKGSYTSVKKSITAALLDAGFTVTEAYAVCTVFDLHSETKGRSLCPCLNGKGRTGKLL